VSLQASAAEVPGGRSVALSGQASGTPAGTPVQLYQSLYPFTGSTVLATARIAADGSFSFTVAPDRDVRYEAVAAGSGSAPIEVDVNPLTITRVKALPLGRAQVMIVAFHPADLPWGGARVSWSFSSGAATVKTSTVAYHLSPHVTVLRAVAALPAGRFTYRACFHAPGERALLDPGRPSGCMGRGYAGSGALPSGFPGARALRRAAAYLRRRGGRTAFAVVDSEGRLSGVDVHRTFDTASVVKAMLLTAYLRRLDALSRRRVDAYSNSLLYPMIHVSDNDAATRCWSIVGDGGLYAVARAAGMRDFSVSGLWGTALLSPADQARFFFAMDSLIPRQFVGYARFLLSTIDPLQSWAIPAVAPAAGLPGVLQGRLGAVRLRSARSPGGAAGGARTHLRPGRDDRRRPEHAVRDRHDSGSGRRAAALIPAQRAPTGRPPPCRRAGAAPPTATRSTSRYKVHQPATVPALIDVRAVITAATSRRPSQSEAARRCGP
jgi:hypothetical protein